MRTFFVLLRLRVLDVTRSRASALLFLVLPAVLLLLVGFVFAEGHPFERRRVALVDDLPAACEASAPLPAACQASAASVPRREGKPSVVLIEEDMARHPDVRATREKTESFALGMLRSHTVSAVVVVRGNQTRLIVGSREQLFARGLAAALVDSGRGPIAVEVVALPRWGYVHYLFPAILTYSVMLSGLFGMGYAMVRYRQNRFLKKLATTPLSRTTFVLAQISARAVLVLGQLALLVAMAHLAFGLPLSVVSAVWLSVFTVLGVLVFMGAGFVMACIVKTEGLFVDLVFAIAVPLIFVSEFFYPADDLPALLTRVSEVLPSTHMVRAMRAVLLYDVTSAGMLMPAVVTMGVWAAAMFGTSIAAFKWHR